MLCLSIYHKQFMIYDVKMMMNHCSGSVRLVVFSPNILVTYFPCCFGYALESCVG